MSAKDGGSASPRRGEGLHSKENELQYVGAHSRHHDRSELFSHEEFLLRSDSREELLSHDCSRNGDELFEFIVSGKELITAYVPSDNERGRSKKEPKMCRICGKCFSRRSYLNVHERLHSGEKPFICKSCGQCFSLKTHLKNHERLHTGEKPFGCTKCEKSFASSSNLRSHERWHIGVKPFVCSTCGKCFLRKSALTQHERVHTGIAPYKCVICGKCFKQRGHLNAHRRVHAEMTTAELHSSSSNWRQPEDTHFSPFERACVGTEAPDELGGITVHAKIPENSDDIIPTDLLSLSMDA